MKMKKITKIIERHHIGCFTVEDIDGDHFLVQLAYKLEEIWQKREAAIKARRAWETVTS
jgi:hypothetical protein